MELRRRDVFLKIERLGDPYSPLSPVPCARRYGRDCMFNFGHELGRVGRDEIFASEIDALVYHEYRDPTYTVPVRRKLVGADVNEPPWERRVPGAVLYAEPGERLYVHVLNADPEGCHSLHVHGVRYGIDSDGSWPFGVASRSGRRSDEIRPGERWTYVFDVTPETVGAWPFHDHVRSVQASVARGLFGALIVREPRHPCPKHEVPMFVHQMAGGSRGSQFEGPLMPPGGGVTFPHRFETDGETCVYQCAIHGPDMSGTVRVRASAPAGPKTVAAKDNFWDPAVVDVRPGETVTWSNQGQNPHIVLATGGGAATYCLNGRAYIGNTPTLEVDSGDSLRWYVFNLDVGEVWHNFHPHATRWQLPEPPGGAADVHSLSPAESFVADTVAPPTLRLPCALEELQCDPPEDACRLRIKGDFLFHCHLEAHMMVGLAGLLRSREWIWITEELADRLDLELPYDDGLNACPWADLTRCHPHRPKPPLKPHDRPHKEHAHEHEQPHPEHENDAQEPAEDNADQAEMEQMRPAVRPPLGTMLPTAGMPMPMEPALDVRRAAREGAWELLPCDSQVLAVHAALLHTGKVIFVSGSGNTQANVPLRNFRSAVWDYENGGFKTIYTPTDVFCSGHAHMPDGRLLVAGGTEQYADGGDFRGARDAYLFDPLIEEFVHLGPMHEGRWYPTLIPQPDGSIVALSGLKFDRNPGGGNNPTPLIECFSYEHGWESLGGDTIFPLYPHAFLVHGGSVWYDGGHVFGDWGRPPGRLTLPHTFAPIGTPLPGNFQLGRRDQSSSVLLPSAQDQKIMLIGGGDPAIDACDIIDLRAANPAYTAAAALNHGRFHLNAVLLPDRTVLVSGGNGAGEAVPTAVLEAEIYHPAADRWDIAAKAEVPRLYHSVAVLLPDGRVITAGSNPEAAVGGGELRLELYHPPYLFRGPRPFIEHSPTEIHYGETFELHTPQARRIKWVELIRPMATTHSMDVEQRVVDLERRYKQFCCLEVEAPDDPTIAPPGWYMLFLVDEHEIPSVARWVHLTQRPKRPGAPEARDFATVQVTPQEAARQREHEREE